MSRDNASWHCAMAYRNWEIQWVFASWSYQIGSKIIQYYVTCKPLACIYNCIDISIYLQCQYSDSFLTVLFAFAFLPVSKFTGDYLCLSFKFIHHLYKQIPLSNFYQCSVLWLLLKCTLLQHKDIERYYGPKDDQIKNLSCCYWNVNSLLARTSAWVFCKFAALFQNTFS